MTPNTPKQTRLIVTAVVVIAAFLMIAAVPFITDSMINPVVKGMLAKKAKFKETGKMKFGVPHWEFQRSGPWRVSLQYPFWTMMSFVGGFVLLATAVPLYKGKQWARGAALVSLAMPSIGGGYMLVPWMNYVGSKTGGFNPGVGIMMIGLIPYFTILLAEKSDLKQKAVNFWVFMMVGITATYNFANGQAAWRFLYGHPARPVIPDDFAILWAAWLGCHITLILLIVAIFKLGSRQWSGWYLAVAGGGATFVVMVATHWVRHTTQDYLFNALAGLFVVVLLVIPAVKKRLRLTPEPEAVEPQAV